VKTRRPASAFSVPAPPPEQHWMSAGRHNQPPPFGEQLRYYRARAGLTQEALAERVELAAATISALERGVRRQPYLHTRQQLAAALGLSAAETAAFVASSPRIRVAAAPPPPSAHTNLPPPRTPLIGRASEVAALRDLIARGETRLVTLTGVGGCGKTRLALQVAADLAGHFPGGAWLVELAPIADPALVSQALAAALGLQETAGVSLLDLALRRLQRQPLLLVLDNCEHLVDACAALVERLLAACPALHILATSREPLQLAGERQWRVPPLATPDPHDDDALANLAGYPAVQLFLARALDVVSTFHLTSATAPAVARICAHLSGLPLAVELAAARVRVLTVAQILDRLDDALRLLTGGSRAAPTRQQTLRATLDWSYALLSPSEQAVFARLAVFAGGSDLDAAEAVCAGAAVPSADMLDLLTRLVDKSLVLVEEGAAAARYRLLEPVRQYALERLAASGDDERTRARHAAYYLALAEQAAPALRGPAQVAWLDRLDCEQDNLRAALRWAEAGGEAVAGLRLAVALAPFWDGRGQLTEGRRWLATFLALPAATVPAALRAQALLASGRLAQWQTDLARAAEILDACLALARPLADWPVVAEALVHLGAVRRRQGAFAESVCLLEESLALYRAADNNAGCALALVTLGVTARFQGEFARSALLLEEGLARFQQCGDVRWIAIAQTMLGVTVLHQGDPARAGRLILAGLAGHQALGDRTFVIFGLLDLAAVFAAQDQPVRAVRLLGAAAALRDLLGTAMAAANRLDQERTVAIVRRQLDAAAFDRAWAAGRVLTLEQALAEAAVPLAPLPAPLTPREADVARLLACGYTDQQIAADLAISARTVGVHVRHLLAKLQVRSRWQVAEWAVAHGLASRE
jgi:non-specific serine/threonine protein kinase